MIHTDFIMPQGPIDSLPEYPQPDRRPSWLARAQDLNRDGTPLNDRRWDSGWTVPPVRVIDPSTGRYVIKLPQGGKFYPITVPEVPGAYPFERSIQPLHSGRDMPTQVRAPPTLASITDPRVKDYSRLIYTRLNLPSLHAQPANQPGGPLPLRPGPEYNRYGWRTR
jgi:hypothetical protein